MIHAADRLLASGHEIFSNGVQQASRLLRKRTTSLIHSEKTHVSTFKPIFIPVIYVISRNLGQRASEPKAPARLSMAARAKKSSTISSNRKMFLGLVATVAGS
jgi:hypothetical protein